MAAAAVADWSDARAAMDQVWSPFVLVAGLLLIGLVADEDGVFASVGHHLARTARTGGMLFLGATLIVSIVTAVLNLDTAVAFLTPVLVYSARSRGEGEAPLLYGCILLANAGSLFLPGSNLTNLIVLGHLHLTGGQFLARMWAPGLAAVVVTAAVVAGVEHRALRVRAEDLTHPGRPVLGLGLAAAWRDHLGGRPALARPARGSRGRRRDRGSPGQGQRTPSTGRGRARPAGTGRALRLGRGPRHPGTALGGPGHAAIPSGPVGQRPRWQRSARCWSITSRPLVARRPPSRPSLRPPGRAQPGSEPVRNRVPGLVLVAARRPQRRGQALVGESHPPRGRGGSASHGRRRRPPDS